MKRCSENMQQIYRRTTCRNVISIKLQSNFIEITLWHGCSPVNWLHISKIPFPRNTSGWLPQLSQLAQLSLEIFCFQFKEPHLHFISFFSKKEKSSCFVGTSNTNDVTSKIVSKNSLNQPIFDQFSAYVESRQLVFTSKMFEKHL